MVAWSFWTAEVSLERSQLASSVWLIEGTMASYVNIVENLSLYCCHIVIIDRTVRAGIIVNSLSDLSVFTVPIVCLAGPHTS